MGVPSCGGPVLGGWQNQYLVSLCPICWCLPLAEGDRKPEGKGDRRGCPVGGGGLIRKGRLKKLTAGRHAWGGVSALKSLLGPLFPEDPLSPGFLSAQDLSGRFLTSVFTHFRPEGERI